MSGKLFSDTDERFAATVTLTITESDGSVHQHEIVRESEWRRVAGSVPNERDFQAITWLSLRQTECPRCTRDVLVLEPDGERPARPSRDPLLPSDGVRMVLSGISAHDGSYWAPDAAINSSTGRIESIQSARTADGCRAIVIKWRDVTDDYWDRRAPLLSLGSDT